MSDFGQFKVNINSGEAEFTDVKYPRIGDILDLSMIKRMFPEIDFKNKKSFEVVTFCDLLDKRDQLNFKKKPYKTLKVVAYPEYYEYYFVGDFYGVKNISFFTDQPFMQRLIGDDFKTGSLFTDKNEDVYITFVLYDEN